MNLSHPYRITAAGLAALVLAGAGAYLWRRRPLTVEQKLARFEQKIKAEGGVVFQTELQGKTMAFLLQNCTLYLLDATGKEVTRTQVLTTGFYLWFASCSENTIRREGEFLRVFLRNVAFGAGGGNASGGDYRSRDGIQWEKFAKGEWLPVSKAQD